MQRCVFNEDKDYFFTIKKIATEDENYRFLADNYSDNEVSWNLFYLVEEPEENEYRPYHSPSEIPGGALLNIVLHNDGTYFIITAADNKRVYLGSNGWVDMQELYDNYMWSNGTPCGIKEDRE